MAEEIFSVSRISRDIRLALEGKFRNVWVEGEVSNLRQPASGHQYFTLKDSGAQLNCVMFRMAVQRNKVQLQDGIQIQVCGDISVYEQRGQYQLVVQVAQTTGHGELQARFEALKRKLHEEGLFDQEKKKPIPRFPRTVGVVTSPSGAAIQDILNVMARRAPWMHLVIIPVKVQGDGAGGEISRAIRYLSTSPDSMPKLDTLIVARGGGSIEDLWSFNEEEVARAIYECPIPVVSGVGHEIDFTIADFVADRREPTPSAAAEASVPDGEALQHRLETLSGRLEGNLQYHFRHLSNQLAALKREMQAREPARKIQGWAQSMDYLEDRLQSAVERKLEGYASSIERLNAILSGWNPDRDIQLARDQVSRSFEKMEQTLQRGFHHKQEEAAHVFHLLQAIGPDKTLERGFSMTLDEQGNPIHDAAVLKEGQLIRTRFGKSEATSRVESVS